jgi:hypothetical protein
MTTPNDDYQPKHAKEETPGFMSDDLYRMLRFIALIALPGVGAAYFSLSGIWGLPEPDKVVGSITVISTFLGLLVRQARVSYENDDKRFDGSVNVTNNGDDTSDVNIQLDPKAIIDKDEVVVKVNKPSALG